MRTVEHFDQEIATIQETCKEGKQAMEERGLEVIAAKQTLVDWKNKYESVSKSLNKKVFTFLTSGISNGAYSRTSGRID